MSVLHKKWLIAGVAIALIGVLVALTVQTPPQGPSRLQLDQQGRVWVLAGKTLFTLSADGKLLAQHKLPAAHALTSASDFALLSNGEVLLADALGRELLRCSAQVQDCRSIYRMEDRGGGPQGDSFKLLVDEARDTLWLADTVGHRLLQLSLAGVDRQQIAQGFLYPNLIGFSAAGDLVVADTDHHRIAGFDPAGNLQAPRWEITGSHPNSRYPQIRPSAFAEVGSNWWLIAHDLLMRNGDVLSFGPDGKPLARILSDAKDPLSLLVVGRQVLVADAESFRVWRAGPEGMAAGVFGDPAFQRPLRTMQAEYQRHRLMKKILPALIAAVALIAALLLKRLGEPVSAPSTV